MRPIDHISKQDLRSAVQDRFTTFMQSSRHPDVWAGTGADVACIDSIIQLFEYLYTERDSDPARPINNRKQ